MEQQDEEDKVDIQIMQDLMLEQAPRGRPIGANWSADFPVLDQSHALQRVCNGQVSHTLVSGPLVQIIRDSM